MRQRSVVVNDKMQQGYRYALSAPAGCDFDPEFKPELTPREMLRLGVFWRQIYDRHPEGVSRELVRAAPSLAPRQRDCSLNFFGVDASQPLSVWRGKGWIHPDDPRGWFQWYCRYYRGRRMPDEDARQIKRWKAMRRHIGRSSETCERGDHVLPAAAAPGAAALGL